MKVLTFGHGTLPEEEFVGLLDEAGVRRLVDVRSFPGSRHNPQFGRSEMERWLPRSDVSYVWSPGLGGRRRPVEDSKHMALRHRAFRAYADHMETTEFGAALEELLRLAEEELTAVMCSESLWWRCHRRLLADHLVLARHIEVVHLMHDGRVTPHPPTDGVRRGGHGVVYDVGAPTELPGLEASS